MIRAATSESTWSLKLEGSMGGLQTRFGHECGLTSLILRAASSRVGNQQTSIKIRRVGSNLFLQGHYSPLLSLCRSRGTRTSTRGDLFSNDIQIGFPGLLSVGSPAFFTLLASWLLDCDRNHFQCQSPQEPPAEPLLPTRLIDVGQKPRRGHVLQEPHSKSRIRILETRGMTGDEEIRYIALSHPWGRGPPHDHFCTTRQNIDSRIHDGIVAERLPDTLKHAVQITRALGIRYLWIDTLCIIQGHDGDFDTEAKRMEMVYSRAYCVIAASRATGTSSGFLTKRPSRREYVVIPKLKTKARSRETGDCELYLCEAIDDFQSHVIEGHLNKRGWVLQERALARRTIYFTETQTYWECGAGVRCETLTKMTNHQAAFLGDPNYPNVAMKSTKGAQIRLYQSLYETYSGLEFTKACDRSIAIAGLEQRLIRAFDTQGGYGIFDKFFGRSLLWMRDTRIQDSMEPINFPMHSNYYAVPSWSWMASEGVITFMDLPFSGVDWRYTREGVVAPWSSAWIPHTPATTGMSTESVAWHTGRAEWKKGAALTARAREFGIPLSEVEKSIVYDSGHRSPNGEAMQVKCVIIGREAAFGNVLDKTALEHYVLVVAKNQGASEGKNEYVRVGVASLPGTWIRQDSPGEKITVV